MKKIKLIHVITGLNGGGAENMLYKLLKHSNREIYDIEVISMTDKGIFGDLIINELKIPVHTLGLSRGSISLDALKKCKEICRKSDVIHSWMYHANLLSFIVAKMLKIKLVWGIHHSDLSKKNNKKMTIYIAKLSALISRFVDKVVSCGDTVQLTHENIGYYKKNHITIPNGFEIDLFKPLDELNKNVKNSEDAGKKILLHVARWDALKDYKNLIESISILKKDRQDFISYLVGKEIDYENRDLTKLLEKYNVSDVVRLLGRRNDIPMLMSSAQVFISSSIGEGLPNVLGEALACETLCVSTDTGDCKVIVDKFGEIVPTQNSTALANAINNVLNMDPLKYSKLAAEGREWIIKNYEINSIVKRYEEVYQKVVL